MFNQIAALLLSQHSANDAWFQDEVGCTSS
jgi:hypothetical protein